jgi:hypothetical protein
MRPLSVDRSHSRVDYNLYEGTEVTGAPEIVEPLTTRTGAAA